MYCLFFNVLCSRCCRALGIVVEYTNSFAFALGTKKDSFPLSFFVPVSLTGGRIP